MAATECDTLIKIYFAMGMTYKDINYTLENQHNIVLSERQLKRRLSNLQLRRRQYDNLSDVVHFIQEQLIGSGQLHGYRMMHAKCLQHGLRVRKEDVRLILKELDPEGVEKRKNRILRRRLYYAKGPNFIWHVDGYDKLKPFGLCINACIDGFSRRIIWLDVYHTNNNPYIIGGYFMSAVKDIGGCPRIVRTDRGTENICIGAFQEFFRPNAREKPFLVGTSTSNQRIEAFWSFLRKQFTQFWMDFFQNLVQTGEFTGDLLDKSLIQFCFMSLIQIELDKIRDMWNTHTIRPSRQDINAPSGRPDVMYFAPHLWGVDNELQLLNQQDIDVCSNQAEYRSSISCDRDIYDVCIDIIARDNLDMPNDAYNAVDLYLHLRGEILLLL